MSKSDRLTRPEIKRVLLKSDYSKPKALSSFSVHDSV